MPQLDLGTFLLQFLSSFFALSTIYKIIDNIFFPEFIISIFARQYLNKIMSGEFFYILLFTKFLFNIINFFKKLHYYLVENNILLKTFNNNITYIMNDLNLAGNFPVLFFFLNIHLRNFLFLVKEKIY